MSLKKSSGVLHAFRFSMLVSFKLKKKNRGLKVLQQF